MSMLVAKDLLKIQLFGDIKMNKKQKSVLIKKLKIIDRNDAWLGVMTLPIIFFTPKEWDYLGEHGFRKLLSERGENG